MVQLSGRKLNKSRTLGIVGATVAVLATSYYIYQKLTSTNGDGDTRLSKDDVTEENKKARKSKCIIMSKSIQRLTINWNEYANDDLVLLVPMSQTNGSLKQQIEDIFQKSGNEHKIIYCDTMDGLWSCVRRIGKFHCILNSKDFTGSDNNNTVVIPDDIGRFAKLIVDSDIESMLVDAICN
ncbi:hypothetical protein SMKI_01G0150 [Saccharomyces mikatae IFO 1815]|uniref:Peroxisome assembly protein 22 n=1 Tax=Saccharomyces mikatae IFO 1815 TaxID=226126 RepID=A0AA35IUA9_SACMI|nr:uncharacterized protein SMKI_01G0150 [Saccharomyces mikatae IFO 1815]CAI4037060.1 hypothetical protein SMKI_01G0150 [Saccharomyces mikatae IFO 1815]